MLEYKYIKKTMNIFSRNNYTWSITKNEIEESTSSDFWVWVKKIQDLKEDIVSKIFSVCNIDSNLLETSENAYHKSLWFYKSRTANSFKKSIENMIKPQSIDFLKYKNWYIWDFNGFVSILKNYVAYPKYYLEELLFDDLVTEKEKVEIRTYIKVSEEKVPENTLSRKLYFDEEIFKFDFKNQVPHKNIECFYEEDNNWNKNYFSINTLLNYIDTFWVEIWLPEIKSDTTNSEILKKYFPSINRKLKFAMHNNILQILRNQQEVLMYWFKDYELISWRKNDNKNWFIAEKIVELEFRELANMSDYNISIVRWSIWEDQQNKVDLYIILEDKKTWIKIRDELQITLKKDLDLKRMQIDKRNRVLRKNWEYSESQLINFAMKDLSKKIHAWKYFNRPIWKLSETLDHSEKAIIRKTFRRLAWKMERKKERLMIN